MPRFKLLAGKHVEGRNEDGTQTMFKRGDVIDSEHDLVAKFNSPGSTKFELMPDEDSAPKRQSAAKGKTSSQSSKPSAGIKSMFKKEDLDKLSVEELKGIAQEEEIDLKGATTKEAMIKAMLG